MLICFHIVKSSFLVCILVQHHIVPMHFHPSASRVLSRILPGVASEVLQWSIHDMTGVLTRVLTGGDSPSHYPSHIPSHHLLIAMTPIIPKHNTFVHFFLHFTNISLKSKGTCAYFFQQSLLANIHSANTQ